MKRVNCFLILFIVLLFGISIFISPQISQASGAKAVEISYANFFPPTHGQAKLGESWAKEVQKRTKGKVKITYYPGGSLLKGPKIYGGIIDGITDMGMSVFAYTRGRFPAMEAIDLPIGYPSGKVATKAINAFYNKFNPKELNNIKIILLHAHGPGLLHSKVEVKSLKDMKGLKIRSTGFSAKAVEALGGVAVAMGQGGTYEALQKGVVDATLSPIEVLKGWKQGEVIKYTTECFSVAYSTGFYVAMNKAVWNKLPKDAQKVMDQVSAEWVPKHGEAWDSNDKAGKEFTLSLGNKIIPLSKQESAQWAEAVKPVIDAYIKGAEGKGLPGKEYVGFIKGML